MSHESNCPVCQQPCTDPDECYKQIILYTYQEEEVLNVHISCGIEEGIFCSTHLIPQVMLVFGVEGEDNLLYGTACTQCSAQKVFEMNPQERGALFHMLATYPEVERYMNSLARRTLEPLGDSPAVAMLVYMADIHKATPGQVIQDLIEDFEGIQGRYKH